MGATSARFPKKDQHSTPPGEGYPEAAISASRLTLFKLSSKLLSVMRSLFKQSAQRRLLQACDSQNRGKTLLLCKKDDTHSPLPPAYRLPTLPQSQPGTCTAVETLSPSPFWALYQPGPAWWVRSCR